jgi:hypothetical protein
MFGDSGCWEGLAFNGLRRSSGIHFPNGRSALRDLSGSHSAAIWLPGGAWGGSCVSIHVAGLWGQSKGLS